MQQWPANRPRCLGVTDAAVEPALLLNYGEYDSFERSPTVWEDAPPVTGSCMYTSTISRAVVPPSCQHQNYYDTLAAPAASYVSSASSIQLKYPAHTATVSSTFTDALLADDQQDSEVLQSPDAVSYHTSPLMDDGSHVEHSVSTSLKPGGSRPKRRPYSKLQLLHLEQEFQRSMYPCRERRAWLSQVLSLTERQVKIWFQNRRTKLKRTTEREQRENAQMQRDMANLAMRFYDPAQ
ncbi:homeobox protein Hox-D8-like [Patiria miniata]|uniref:Homeobox domain-containing protein n=1 Tax=Patiria miniata TaxID=46514 RepID=A0A914BKI7_PATMI|nr:homeobox protein Hox-D8-like [Patiria miniata]